MNNNNKNNKMNAFKTLNNNDSSSFIHIRNGITINRTKKKHTKTRIIIVVSLSVLQNLLIFFEWLINHIAKDVAYLTAHKI